jgi:hypothetical protein
MPVPDEQQPSFELAGKRRHLPRDEDGDQGDQAAADGAGQERGEISAAQEQGAAEVFLQHGAEMVPSGEQGVIWPKS